MCVTLALILKKLAPDSRLFSTRREDSENSAMTSTATALAEHPVEPAEKAQTNPLKLRKIHHVEMWVGNARQAAYFYRRALGFRQIAYAGLETGLRNSCSFVLEQGQARLVLTSSYDHESEISRHVALHGDGVRDICFHVNDVDSTFAATTAQGAEPSKEPYNIEDEHGSVRRATIKTYGDTVHSLVSDQGYSGPFLPGYTEDVVETESAGLLRFDHIVGNVELGQMEHWANWYGNVLGFKKLLQFDDEQISTEFSALMSIVMSDNSYAIKFPINEPAAGRHKSQIEEYLDFYRGPGVQHIAMLTRDIVQTVHHLIKNGVRFIAVPDSYYEALPERIGEIDESIRDLQPLGILVDRDHEGYLLQLFTQPVVDRPTLFFEIIQRKGSRGFGEGNFKALFEAIERDQAKRGNL
jgi:4-hydroxyphenylpyruvate dioxygenase